MNKTSPIVLPSVLLIDDNEDDNFIHSRQILNLGLVSDPSDVFVKMNGRDALEFLQAYEENRARYGDGFPPPLVLLDINMPVMNGFEFLERYEELSKKSGYDSVVILMITSSSSLEDQRMAEGFRCLDGFYTKPITRDKLLDIVEKHFA